MRVLRCPLVVSIALCAGAHVAASEPADLPSLLAEAERAHPALLAARARADAADAVPAQLQALPDPRLSVAYTNDGLSSFTLGDSKFSNIAVRWDQDVPYRSVRERASEAAQAEAAAVRTAAATQAARLRARIVAAFADLWSADAESGILEQGRSLLSAGIDAARARYESGEGSQDAVLRAQIALHRLELEIVDVERRRRAAEIALAEAVGREGDPSFDRVGALPVATVPSDDAAAEAAAAAGAPEVVEARAGEARARAVIEDARAQTKPEFGWTAQYQYLGGLDPMVMGGMTVRLPVWKGHKQELRVAEAQREAEAESRAREASEIEARARVRSLLNAAASAQREQTIYAEAIVPQDRAAVEAARAALSAGRVEMGAVLDGTARWLEDRRAAVGLAAARVRALADLEAATGLTIFAAADAGGAR